MPDAGFENVAVQRGSARRVGQARAGIGWRLQDQTFKRRGGGTPVFLAGVPGLLSAGERAGSCGCVYNGEPQESAGRQNTGASRRPGSRRRGPRVMAKGEGAESGSAAGLLPTGILQASERPVQVKVRCREEGKGWWADREVGTGASEIRLGLWDTEGRGV